MQNPQRISHKYRSDSSLHFRLHVLISHIMLTHPETKALTPAPAPQTRIIDYYDVLELRRGATAAEIDAAHKRLALIYHPDKFRGAEKPPKYTFEQINEAHDILANPRAREHYHKYLTNPHATEFVVTLEHTALEQKSSTSTALVVYEVREVTELLEGSYDYDTQVRICCKNPKIAFAVLQKKPDCFLGINWDDITLANSAFIDLVITDIKWVKILWDNLFIKKDKVAIKYPHFCVVVVRESMALDMAYDDLVRVAGDYATQSETSALHTEINTLLNAGRYNAKLQIIRELLAWQPGGAELPQLLTNANFHDPKIELRRLFRENTALIAPVFALPQWRSRVDIEDWLKFARQHYHIAIALLADSAFLQKPLPGEKKWKETLQYVLYQLGNIHNLWPQLLCPPHEARWSGKDLYKICKSKRTLEKTKKMIEDNPTLRQRRDAYNFLKDIIVKQTQGIALADIITALVQAHLNADELEKLCQSHVDIALAALDNNKIFKKINSWNWNHIIVKYEVVTLRYLQRLGSKRRDSYISTRNYFEEACKWSSVCVFLLSVPKRNRFSGLEFAKLIQTHGNTALRLILVDPRACKVLRDYALAERAFKKADAVKDKIVTFDATKELKAATASAEDYSSHVELAKYYFEKQQNHLVLSCLQLAIDNGYRDALQYLQELAFASNNPDYLLYIYTVCMDAKARLYDPERAMACLVKLLSLEKPEYEHLNYELAVCYVRGFTVPSEVTVTDRPRQLCQGLISKRGRPAVTAIVTTRLEAILLRKPDIFADEFALDPAIPVLLEQPAEEKYPNLFNAAPTAIRRTLLGRMATQAMGSSIAAKVIPFCEANHDTLQAFYWASSMNAGIVNCTTLAKEFETQLKDKEYKFPDNQLMHVALFELYLRDQYNVKNSAKAKALLDGSKSPWKELMAAIELMQHPDPVEVLGSIQLFREALSKSKNFHPPIYLPMASYRLAQLLERLQPQEKYLTEIITLYDKAHLEALEYTPSSPYPCETDEFHRLASLAALERLHATYPDHTELNGLLDRCYQREAEANKPLLQLHHCLYSGTAAKVPHQDELAMATTPSAGEKKEAEAGETKRELPVTTTSTAKQPLSTPLIFNIDVMLGKLIGEFQWQIQSKQNKAAVAALRRITLVEIVDEAKAATSLESCFEVQLDESTSFPREFFAILARLLPNIFEKYVTTRISVWLTQAQQILHVDPTQACALCVKVLYTGGTLEQLAIINSLLNNMATLAHPIAERAQTLLLALQPINSRAQAAKLVSAAKTEPYIASLLQHEAASNCVFVLNALGDEGMVKIPVPETKLLPIETKSLMPSQHYEMPLKCYVQVLESGREKKEIDSITTTELLYAANQVLLIYERSLPGEECFAACLKLWETWEDDFVRNSANTLAGKIRDATFESMFKQIGAAEINLALPQHCYAVARIFIHKRAPQSYENQGRRGLHIYEKLVCQLDEISSEQRTDIICTLYSHYCKGTGQQTDMLRFLAIAYNTKFAAEAKAVWDKIPPKNDLEKFYHDLSKQPCEDPIETLAKAAEKPSNKKIFKQLTTGLAHFNILIGTRSVSFLPSSITYDYTQGVRMAAVGPTLARVSVTPAPPAKRASATVAPTPAPTPSSLSARFLGALGLGGR